MKLLLLASSTGAVAQLAIPLTQLNPAIPLKNGDTPVVKVVDDQLFVGAEKGLWILRRGGRVAARVENIEEYVLTIKMIDNQLFVAAGNELWIVSQDGVRVSKVPGVKGVC